MLRSLVKMDDYLKSALKTKVLTKFGRYSGGCISSGCGYETDNCRVFVKTNSKSKANIMFMGEFHGLEEIYNTKTVKVPKPLLTGEVNSEYFIVMDYHEILPLDRYSSNLGRDLAQLHMHNISLSQNSNNFVGANANPPVDKFGFHVTTCCGFLPQCNEWASDWIQFYTTQRLQPQIEMIEQKKSCREISELWSELQLKIPSFFRGISVKPSLLHGDLWNGNAGETNEGAIVFDPASFYGHHEYDLAIAGMFGGFSKDFYDEYFNLIPKQKGFEKRHNLYKLFHYLNHWNHFGNTYKSSCITLMKDLIK